MVAQVSSVQGSSVQVAATREFTYTPPPAAHGATRILVKPNLGYPVDPPATVSMAVLGKVLLGLRAVNPTAEILIVEGVCSKVSLQEIASKNGLYNILGEGMQLLDADTLPQVPYPNRADAPVRFQEMMAPKLLTEVDCRISVGAFKLTSLKGSPLLSASLKNLYGLFPRAQYKTRSPHSRGQLHRPSVPQVLQDVYFSIGHLFDGSVVDCDQKFVSKDWHPDRGDAVPIGKVIWGDNLIAVDSRACDAASEPVAPYLTALRQLTDGHG
ncbi:MAG: DUF362 domain-containing protein [Cyanobacteria bacterium J06632_22]